MRLINSDLKIILDSRGKETLEASLCADSRGFARMEARASAPSGKSVGSREAFVLEPKKALKKFEEIKPLILSASAGGRIESQEEFDDFLISLDGAENKSNLGGNLILVLSLAFARLKAKAGNRELFQYIRSIFQFSDSSIFKFPKPVFNVINGGAHASNALDFQEFQVIPETDNFETAYGVGKIFYRKLGQELEGRFGKENVFLGDEAGYSVPFKSNEEAIEFLAELIAKHNYPLKIGLDAAASQLYQRPTTDNQRLMTDNQRQGFYLIGGKRYSADELKELYLKLIETYGILSIEDPFYEESFDDFAGLNEALPSLPRGAAPGEKEILLITDDLTATNLKRLKKAIEKKSGNAILIKPNQIGTLTETLKVVKFAYENGWRAVVSHRSGETLDDFIADLAVGVGAWGIKAGAPAKAERLAKYERMLKILKIGN